MRSPTTPSGFACHLLPQGEKEITSHHQAGGGGGGVEAAVQAALVRLEVPADAVGAGGRVAPVPGEAPAFVK